MQSHPNAAERAEPPRAASEVPGGFGGYPPRRTAQPARGCFAAWGVVCFEVVSMKWPPSQIVVGPKRSQPRLGASHEAVQRDFLKRVDERQLLLQVDDN